MKIYIYGLVDPRTQEIRYVGQTNHLKYRCNRHIADSKRGAVHYVNKWIRTVLKDNVEPRMITLDCVSTDKEANEHEIWWIAYGKQRGWRLTNLTDGGLGSRGCSPSEETRKKMSKASAMHRHSDETKRKIGDAQRGEKSHCTTLKRNDVVNIITLWKTGQYTQKQLGEKFGVSRTIIGKITRGERWSHIARELNYDPDLHIGDTRGARHPYSKLDEGKVKTIRDLYATEKYTQKEIADIYGVSSGVVSKVVNYKAWSWVD